jgi:hypothetical protein
MMGQTQDEKRRLLALLRERFDEAIAALEGVDYAKVVYIESGWTVKDLIGHVAAWEAEMLKSLEAYAQGREYRIAGFTDDDTFNAQSHARRKDLNANVLMAEWTLLRTTLMQLVETLSNDQLAGSMLYPWGGRGSASNLINDVIGHQTDHIGRILIAVGRQRGGESARLHLLVDDGYRFALAQLAPVDPNLVVYEDSGWTVKDNLAHVVVWEAEMVKSLEAYAQGGTYLIPDYPGDDAFNAAAYAQHKDDTLAQVYADWAARRQRTHALIDAMTDTQLGGELTYEWDERGTVAGRIEWSHQHLRQHMEHILAAWGAQGTGEGARLNRLMKDTYTHALQTLNLIDPRTVIYQDSGWRVKDLIAHLVAWDEPTLECFIAYTGGRESSIPGYAGVEAFNQAQYQQRKDDSMEAILYTWDNLVYRLRAIVSSLTDAQLDGEMMFPSGNREPAKQLGQEIPEHWDLHLNDIRGWLRRCES